MERPYQPHPGKLPTEEEARKRWKTPNSNGEMPYEAYVDLALNGEGPFEKPVVPRAGESTEALALRLQKSGELQKMAARTVALGLQGKDFLREGRRTVHTAEVLAHRDAAKFRTDPTPMRGSLKYCVSREEFRRICPSVAVNLSALRSLVWSDNLRPKDLLLLWILIGAKSAGNDRPEIASLKQTFGISRPHDSLRRIAAATYTVQHDPAVAQEEWVVDASVMVDGEISDTLIAHVKPRAGGQNYAYLELVALAALSARWQEQALRGIMSAAVRARIYWQNGGRATWELKIDDAMRLFSLEGGDINRLRKERVRPLGTVLKQVRDKAEELAWRNLGPALMGERFFGLGTRFSLEYGTNRASEAQGRPVESVLLNLRVFSANPLENPSLEYAVYRTQDRKLRQPTGLIKLAGLGKTLTQEELRAKRSAAAKKGWIARKGGNAAEAIKQFNARPRTENVDADLAAVDAMLEELGILDDGPFEQVPPSSGRQNDEVDSVEGNPEAAYGFTNEEGHIADWDNVLSNYYRSIES